MKRPILQTLTLNPQMIQETLPCANQKKGGWSNDILRSLYHTCICISTSVPNNKRDIKKYSCWSSAEWFADVLMEKMPGPTGAARPFQVLNASDDQCPKAWMRSSGTPARVYA